MKRCKQCGDIKPVVPNFRPYYHRNTASYYKVCKACEKINNRLKYLLNKPRLMANEELEVSQINELHALQREQGLRPPGGEDQSIDLVSALERQRAKAAPELSTAYIPQELQLWLDASLEDYTVEHLEEISDMLMAKYKSQIGVDVDLSPIYDDTYRDALNAVLKRFDDYEDSTYN